MLALTGSFWLALVAPPCDRHLRRLMYAVTLRPLIGRDQRPHPGHLRRLAGAAELRAVAVRRRVAGSRADHRPLASSISIILVPGGGGALVGRDHRRLHGCSEVRHLGHLDRATTPDRVMAQAMGIRSRGCWPACSPSARAWRRERRAGRSLRRRRHDDGAELDPARLHRRCGRRHRQPRRLGAGGHLISLLEAYASLWVQPSQAVIVRMVLIWRTCGGRPACSSPPK